MRIGCFRIVYAFIPALAFALTDPTVPTATMADALTRRLADSAEMRLQALVVGAHGDGVALLGSSAGTATAVRRGSLLTRTVDGVKVETPIKSVTTTGVELGVSEGSARAFVPGSYQALAVPTNAPAEFIAYLESANVPLGRLVRLLADQTGVNISTSDATAEKPVSIFLRNVTVDAAVEEICRTAGLWFRREAASRVIRITTMDEYAESLSSFREEITETFTLLYPNVIEVASVIYGLYPDRTLLSLGEEEILDEGEYDLSRRFRRFRVLEDNGGANFMDVQAPRASSASAGNGSGVFSFSEGSAMSRLMQWDELRRRNRLGNREDSRRSPLSANEAQALDRLRASGNTNALETARGQALLGAANIFVTLSRKNNLLVVRTSDVKVMDEIRRMVKQLDVPTPMVLMEVKVLELDITDDFESDFSWSLTDVVAGQRINGLSTHTVGTPLGTEPNLTAAAGAGATALNPTFAFSVIGDRVRSKIALMQKDGRVKTLSTPTLLTANNEVSRIFSGKEYPLVTGWTRSETTATDGVVVQNPATVQIEKKDVGTMLLITPNINADKTVTLHLLQENSAVADDKVMIPVDGGSGESKEIEYVDSRSLTGTFVAKDGMTVMAGGLVREHDEDVAWRTPVLGSIPYLGWLFRGTSKEKRRTELVVLIRPYVISTPMEGGKISAELMKKLSAHPAADGRTSLDLFKKGEHPGHKPHTVKDDLQNLIR